MVREFSVHFLGEYKVHATTLKFQTHIKVFFKGHSVLQEECGSGSGMAWECSSGSGVAREWLGGSGSRGAEWVFLIQRWWLVVVAKVVVVVVVAPVAASLEALRGCKSRGGPGRAAWFRPCCAQA